MIIQKLIIGVVFGFCVSRIGFHDFDEIHKMFSFADMRMFFAFALGTVILVFTNLIRNKGRVNNQLKYHNGITFGSISFGVGWALTGACPLVVFLQLAHGYVPAVCTLAGIVVGMLTYRGINRRFFGWKIRSCGE